MKVLDTLEGMGSITQVRIALSFLSKREFVVFSLLVFLRAIAGLLDLIGILLVALVVNIFTSSGTGSTAMNSLPSSVMERLDSVSSDPIVLALYLGILSLVVFVLKGIFSAGLSLRTAHQIARIESWHSFQWQEKVLKSQVVRNSNYQPNEVSHLLTFGCSALFSRTLVPFSAALADSLVLLATLIVLLVLQPSITLFAIAYFAMIGLVLYRIIGKRIESFGNKHLEAQLNSTQLLSDWLNIQRELFITGRLDNASARFKVERERASHSLANTLFMAGLPRYVVETGLIVGAFLLAWFEFSTKDPASAATTLALFLASGTRITPSLLSLLNANSSIRQSSAEASKTLDLLEAVDVEGPSCKEEMVQPASSHKHPQVESAGVTIELVNVSFRYGEIQTIDNVNVDFTKGMFSAIIGPSGAGKSTLADLMLGVLVPSAGQVLIQGIPASDFVEIYPGAIGFVPQSPQLINGTFAENVAFALSPKEIDYGLVDQVCEEAQLSGLLQELPEGIHTQMDNRSVSGGQLQRIGIARALYGKPRLLIMDEPTSALDADTENSIASVLGGLEGKVTLIVIAHRYATVQHASKIIVLEEGKVTESGRFDDLLKNSPLVERQARLMQLISPEILEE